MKDKIAYINSCLFSVVSLNIMLYFFRVIFTRTSRQSVSGQSISQTTCCQGKLDLVSVIH